MKKSLAFAILSFAAISVFAQSPDKALAAFVRQHSQEKVYVHYDKEYYAAGETIWFKAYFYNNAYPDALSTNFYLQLLDKKGKIIGQKLYPIAGATAAGSIDLPDSLLPGSYFVRAGTPAMLQGDDNFLYKKTIYVTNGRSKPAPAASTADVNMEFFPESGSLIDGILTVVAFKATTPAGRPVDVAGFVKTPEGVEIPFKSSHDGIGKFQLRAKAGQSYIAEVKINGKSSRFNLPEVKLSGVNLRVQDEKGGKLFQLARGEKEKEKFETVNLVVQLNNTVVYDNRISFDNFPSIKGHLLTDSLPSGILHFTVFNENMVPVAERLAFVDNGEYRAAAGLTVAKKSLDKKGENNLELSFSDGTPRTLSVAVVDAAAAELADRENIYSRMLLTSDLKSYVYNPAYYFENTSDSLKQALDNLLMAHSWSRFQWPSILSANTAASSDKPVYLIQFSGTVLDKKENIPLNGGRLNIFLESSDSSAQAFVIPVDAKGRFTVDSLLFTGEGRFFYGYMNAAGKQKDAAVAIDDNAFSRKWTRIPANWVQVINTTPVLDGTTPLPAVYWTGRNETQETRPLDEVVLKSGQKRPMDVTNEKYASGLFKTMGKIVIDNINNPYPDGSLNVVRFIEQNVRTIKLQGGRFVNSKNFSMKTGQMWDVETMLNEGPISIANLAPINMNDVAMIKFYEAGFPGVGTASPGGAIVIYTKNTDERPKQQQMDMDHFVYNGYSVVKQFTIPDYSKPAVAPPTGATAMPDLRTTLYWNPAVFTSAEAPKFSFRFFNNDITRKYKVIVEGFDAKGRLVHIEKIVE